MAVVALGNERGPDGVKKSRAETAGAFIKIARVLVKHGLREGVADQNVGDGGGVVDAKALEVPFRPLAELAIGGVAPLLDSGAGCIATSIIADIAAASANPSWRIALIALAAMLTFRTPLERITLAFLWATGRRSEHVRAT